MKAPINAALLLGALAALASGFDTRADLLPDAVEVPIATRHFQHNERFNNSTPGIVVQWRTPLTLASAPVRAHAALFRNSDGDATVYAGLHPEWRVAGPLYAGFGVGATYGYKRFDYSGNAWRDGEPFTVGAVSGRRYEKRTVKPAAQLDARLELNKHYSLTLHLVMDDKACRRQPDGLRATSCAMWFGLRGEW